MTSDFMGITFAAYELILERYPDPEGFAYWVEQLEATNPTTETELAVASKTLVDVFMQSDEYQAVKDRVLDDAQTFLDDLYHTTLLRAPDEAGMAYWLESLGSGQVNRAEVAYYFITSQESVDKFHPTGSAAGQYANLLSGGAEWTTSGNQILDPKGSPVQLTSVSWFGFEGSDGVIDGLWARSYKDMLDQIKDEGFNTIRLPFASESLTFMPNTTDPSAPNYTYIGQPGDPIYTDNIDFLGKSSLEMMDLIIGYAGQIDLNVVLDHHRMSLGVGTENGLWYNDVYSASDWISTWQQLAVRYAGNATVIGADIQNEPYQGTWGGGGSTDWAMAAETVGNAILSANPNWLIVVEGVQTYDSSDYWWGGNLAGVADRPIELDVSDKVVYSPHDYPSSVSSQPWFSDPAYPTNLPSVWDEYWGFIYKEDIAPIWVGEFGTKLETTSDEQWLNYLAAYLGGDYDNDGVSDIPASDKGMSWAYFGWGPNSGDTGGILQDDWINVWQDKLAALEPAYT